MSVNGVIFVGTEYDAGFIKEVGNQRGFDTKIIECSGRIDVDIENIQWALNEIEASFFVIEPQRYVHEETDYIIQKIKNLQTAKNIKAIIINQTDSEDNEIIAEAHRQGLKLFIYTFTSMGEQKQQLSDCLTGVPHIKKEETEEFKSVAQIMENSINKAAKHIAVAGTIRHIGTTTQSIQIVKHLENLGYRACLIEMNENKYINRLVGSKELSFIELAKNLENIRVQTSEDEDIGRINLYNCDMYYNSNKLDEIKMQNYDFFVYDYGTIGEKNFQKNAFMKDDIKIIVAGSKNTEIDAFLLVAENPAYKNCEYVFSFTDERNLEQSVKNFIGIFDFSENQIHKAPYIPDPYVLASENIYEKILDFEKREQEDKPGEKRKKKRIGFFNL